MLSCPRQKYKSTLKVRYLKHNHIAIPLSLTKDAPRSLPCSELWSGKDHDVLFLENGCLLKANGRDFPSEMGSHSVRIFVRSSRAYWYLHALRAFPDAKKLIHTLPDELSLGNIHCVERMHIYWLRWER